ncbi:MAG TPA: hypothetical protein VMJ10_34150 [Kofleriaceae bacterium]|nr:hypothetical protein [Kofleriaceae bacterium]
MRGGRVVVVSVAVHAAAIAALVRFVPRRAIPAVIAEPSVQRVEVEIVPAPLAVALIEDLGRPVARTRATAIRAPGGGAAPAQQIEARSEHAGAGSAELAPPQPVVDLRAALDALVTPGDRVLPPAAGARSGRVDDAPGGRAVIHDTVTTAEIDRDGSVHLHDARDFEAGWSPLVHAVTHYDELRHGLGKLIDDWSRDPYAGLRAASATPVTREAQAIPDSCGSGVDCARLAQDRTLPRNTWTFSAPVVVGKFDITSWLMRKTVGDPYSSRKRALLEQTFDERAERGAAFRADQRAHSAELARKNLEQLWAATLDPAARRAALFELWDECDDDEAGARARAMIVGWIRTHLPAGGPDAYTPAELAALSAHRSSAAPFAPYDP